MADKKAAVTFKAPLTAAEKARRANRNEIIIVILLLLVLLGALAVGFVKLVLPYAKPVENQDLLMEAEKKMKQKIGEALNISLDESKDTSGNRQDPALSKITIGRYDPFVDLKPEPPAPEPEWPSIRYAGVIRSSNKLYAIIEIGQETYSARPGDTLVGGILVSRVNESKVTLTYKGYQREFVLGGESK